MKKIVNLIIEIAEERNSDYYEFIEIPITPKIQIKIKEAISKEEK